MEKEILETVRHMLAKARGENSAQDANVYTMAASNALMVLQVIQHIKQLKQQIRHAEASHKAVHQRLAPAPR